MAPKKRTAVLISGRGSNMMALVAAARRPDYPADIVSIVSSRPDSSGLAWARAEALPATLVDHKAYASREAFDAAIDDVLADAAVELVALAGFMRIQSPAFVSKWQGRQLNIHPSLLPAFKGLNPQAQALAAGVKISGCSVHFVTAEVDSGPIIAQAAVPVLDGDSAETLAARILAAEHRLYPEALALVATGRARLIGDRVEIGPGEAAGGGHGQAQP
ncbi:MAG TPA: phosphoribosylglycinamide formyltransferase [Hyphomicrobiaceae bacterium]|nr:phosphoribosylglycinamide formyltransferase [Hyphomicrobiaceae bacterium]